MTLNKNLSYSMAVILLCLLFKYENLTLKLHQKKSSYLDGDWLLTAIFKVPTVPRMRHKEVFALFVYRHA